MLNLYKSQTNLQDQNHFFFQENYTTEMSDVRPDYLDDMDLSQISERDKILRYRYGRVRVDDSK